MMHDRGKPTAILTNGDLLPELVTPRLKRDENWREYIVAALGRCVPPTLELLPSRSNVSWRNFRNFPPPLIFPRIFRLIRFFLLENYRYECFFIGFLIGLIKRVKERNNRLRISNIFSITIRKKNILILNLRYILWYLIIELKLHLIIEFTFESNKNSDNERWSLWTKFSKLSDWLLK